jgi:hypothetical protein
MQQNSKSTGKIVEIESGSEWTIKARTRGKDLPGTDPNRPTQTWILILANVHGHRKFVPEGRLWELFRKQESNP